MVDINFANTIRSAEKYLLAHAESLEIEYGKAANNEVKDIRKVISAIFLLRKKSAQIEKHPEHSCENCNGTNVVWFAPSIIWNAVARHEDGTDPMLCPICFIKLAESKGYNKQAWEIKPESA